MTTGLSILCFGNSLTAGFYNYGLKYHPYAIKLKEILQQAFPSHTINIDVEGLPGDLAICPPGRFLPRIQSRCSETRYDLVIVLGGTNDLGYGCEPSKIYPALQESWNVALTSGASVLALTIPECAAVNKSLDDRRDELNSYILSHQAERFYAFDLRSKIPHHSATEEFRKKVFDDGLHLTPEGYDLVGGFVGEHLIELLKLNREV